MEKINKEFEIADLRSLDDFLLKSARFQVPDVRDFDKWGNRVIHNLLYYQTNYFLMALIIFLLVGVLHPVEMLCGGFAVAIGFTIFNYVISSTTTTRKLRSDYPFLSFLLMIFGCYIAISMIGSVLVFLLGNVLPIAVIFIHASMRLRNTKNKIFNKVEEIGFKKITPMGILLGYLGVEREFFS